MTNPQELTLLLDRLAAMPEFIVTSYASLSATDAVTSLSAGEFAPVEQAWHLADLEVDGFAERIRRLLEEEQPTLADFDGRRVAAERNYKTLPIREGIAAFRRARLANVERLRRVIDSQWARRGSQEGVGEISLADVPRMMEEHDASHRDEIVEWARARGRQRHS